MGDIPKQLISLHPICGEDGWHRPYQANAFIREFRSYALKHLIMSIPVPSCVSPSIFVKQSARFSDFWCESTRTYSSRRKLRRRVVRHPLHPQQRRPIVWQLQHVVTSVRHWYDSQRLLSECCVEPCRRSKGDLAWQG